MSIISISGLTKSYKSQRVLNNLSWQIEQGDIIGLLGVNGAGKSTLLKSILNLVEVDAGEITLYGENNQHLSALTKAKIGYVPQENDEISWLTVQDLFKFRQQFYKKWDQQKVEDLVKRWNIDCKKQMGKLSPGQAQKVLIILALASQPELLILDEPASALDPLSRRAFLKEIISLTSEEEITVVFSTHIVSDLERVANKVAILNNGVIKYFDEIDALKENVTKISLSGNSQQLNQLLIPNILTQQKSAQNITAIVSKLEQTWLDTLTAQDISITSYTMSLEDIFLELII